MAKKKEPKPLQVEIEKQLEQTLSYLKDTLGEKKFKRKISKASKLLSKGAKHKKHNKAATVSTEKKVVTGKKKPVVKETL